MLIVPPAAQWFKEPAKIFLGEGAISPYVRDRDRSPRSNQLRAA